MTPNITIDELLALYQRQGCVSLYAKPLAANDNSKNQIYFGTNLEFANLFPNNGIKAESSTILKASLEFYWLSPSGDLSRAPNAQLILYPQYPEVRFSGFKDGCDNAPDAITHRMRGRTLFLGVTSDSRIIGYVTSNEDVEPSAVDRLAHKRIGVFRELDIQALRTGADTRSQLIQSLRGVYEKHWIDSKQLNSRGQIEPCTAPQCGGFTLEAELGIPKNSKAEPDYLGYEVKQHGVTSFDRPLSGAAITLMTPEPKLGFYAEHGVAEFIRRFGYPDRNGREDRLNFGGVHKVNQVHHLTGLRLSIIGYDPLSGKILDAKGSIALLTAEDEHAAGWSFSELMSHWTRKHAKATYVPSIARKTPSMQYAFGHTVRIAEQTDFIRLLAAFACGDVYYDPGIKLEQASSAKPKEKRRSQFRIASKNIPSLYRTVDSVRVANA
jgi:hypothetical protein